MTYPQPNDGFAWTQAAWGGVLQCTALARLADHFFTARQLTLRDRQDEWNAVRAHIGVAVDDLLLIRQVHGADVTVASTGRQRPWAAPRADAIVSDDRDAAIAVRVADCVPVLLADDTGRAVAAVHAGWRGIAAGTIPAAIGAMAEHFGVQPARLIAAIGPSIGPCCYEVGDETRKAFLDAGHSQGAMERWFTRRPNEKFHLDLWRAAGDQLEAAGVGLERVHLAGLCTKTHSDAFHSYRADGGQAGRLAAVIRPRS